MDIALLRSFLEVASTGSFMNAADRLFVTQSAVSQRIQRLEDQIGRPLFTRSKAGVALTPAGRAFEGYALSLVKLWEEARQRIAVPEGFTSSLSIGAQYSLWPRLGFRLMDSLRAEMPNLSLRAEIGLPDRLTRYLLEGVVQLGLMYTPQMRPGLTARRIMEEDLILVAAWPEPALHEVAGRYVLIDWGPEFIQAHSVQLPQMTHAGMMFSLGAMTADFIRTRGFAAYVPARYVKRDLDAGVLHLVPEAPVFSHPAWAVWRDDLDLDVAQATAKALDGVKADIDRVSEDVLKDLARLNEGGDIATLGPESGPGRV